MCLRDIKFDNLGRVEAWKLFSIYNGRLYSAFSVFFNKDLPYELNVPIDSIGQDWFYANKTKKSCAKILDFYNFWALTGKDLHDPKLIIDGFCILPVVLFKEVYCGTFQSCGDAYIGKRIWIPKTTIRPLAYQIFDNKRIYIVP